jgi:Protein of unknown function (DUF998)
MAEARVLQPTKEVRAAKVIRSGLLVCGILSSLLYIGADIVAAMSWPSYSYTSQSISELFAIGSPVKWIFAYVPYSPLVIAFGIGVWWSAGRRRALRTTGILLFAYGTLSQAASRFPMHLRGATGSLTDTMHILMTVALVILILLFIGFGATAAGKWFRIYSIGTILTLVVFGGLAGAQGPRIASNLPTPWLGIEERVNVYSAMLWVVVLGVILLCERERTGRVGGGFSR